MSYLDTMQATSESQAREQTLTSPVSPISIDLTNTESHGHRNVIRDSFFHAYSSDSPPDNQPPSKNEPQTAIAELSQRKYDSDSALWDYGSRNGGASRLTPATWLPYTLRIPFLWALIVASLVLCLSVCGICWLNMKHHSLGKDDGSSGMLFAWRFTPTVIAVLFAQAVSMVFNDIRVTEPYARMARLGGGPAPSTVFYSPKFVWSTLIEGFSKAKNDGRFNWTFICSSLAYIVAVFGISPLSSSFLTSQDVVVPRAATITRMAPSSSPLRLSSDRDTFVRTTNFLLQNLTATAWISNSFVALPFRPIDEPEALRLGSVSSSVPGTWTAITSVYGHEHRCDEMSISPPIFANQSFTAPAKEGGLVYGTVEMATINLSVEGGCHHSITVEPSKAAFQYSDIEWTNNWTSVYAIDEDSGEPKYITFRDKNHTYLDIVPEVSSTSPWLRINSTPECEGKNFVYIMQPIILTDPFSKTQPNTVTVEDPRRRALLCSSSFYAAEIPVTMSLSRGISSFSFSNDEYMRKRTALSQDDFDIAKYNDLLYKSDWLQYINSIQADSGPQVVTPHASLVLLAMYGNNVTRFFDDPSLSENIGLVSSRLFGEVIQTSILQANASQAEVIQGETNFIQRRVVVVKGVGVTIAVLLGVCFCFLVVLIASTRRESRPLNLRRDPSTVLGVIDALRLAERDVTLWRPLWGKSRKQTMAILKHKRFETGADMPLRTISTESVNHSSTGPKPLKRWWTGLARSATGSSNPNTNPDWRPRVIRLRMLLAFLGCLVVFLIAITVLRSFARRGKLHQSLFVFETTLSFLNGPLSTIAPFSILPTLFAVAIGVWWDALDQLFRSLQPYLSMAEPGGTKPSQGPNLSYQYSYWFWAAAKAAKNKHWVLVLVTLGSTLSQLFTVSVSALFERSPGINTRTVILNNSMEMRQIPFSVEERFVPGDPMDLVVQGFVPSLGTYFPPSTHLIYRQNWMHSAFNELTLNGSEPSWSTDSWSFIPIDLATITNATLPVSSDTGASSDGSSQTFSTQNVTITTPAIRTRLECSIIPEVQNTSSWLEDFDLTNQQIWDVRSNPKGLVKGYKFQANTMFDGTPWNTSLGLSTPDRLCCNDNTTGVAPIQNITIGYWSPIDTLNFPDPFISWPMNFTVKWIHGPARSDIFLKDSNSSDILGFSEPVAPGQGVLLFTETPSMQAMTCKPTIETANSLTTVDTLGRILSYNLLEEPRAVDAPWMDAMVAHNLTAGEKPTQTSQYIIRNMTTSYGIYFLSSILAASELQAGAIYQLQDPKDGLNFDFMSQSVYHLANESSEAPLNGDVLASLSERTFQTFFKHFVSRNITSSGQSIAYQRIGAKLPSDLGQRIIFNGSAEYQARMRQAPIYASLNTNRTATAQVSTQIEVLRMNDVATWLSVAILVWLIITTVVVALLQRQYLQPLLRNVECIADVIVLVAGSEELMRLVRERGIERLKGDKDVSVRLGWFRRDGDLRWGVEVVNSGEGKVEWVDAKKA